MEMMTAQRGWHDICRRFTSIIYNDICNANILSDISDISLMKIPGRQSNWAKTNCATTNWATRVGQLDDNAPNFLRLLCMC